MSEKNTQRDNYSIDSVNVSWLTTYESLKNIRKMLNSKNWE
jgi:hypothetical protein